MATATVSVVPSYMSPGIADAASLVISAALQSDNVVAAATDGADGRPGGAAVLMSLAALILVLAVLGCWLRACSRHEPGAATSTATLASVLLVPQPDNPPVDAFSGQLAQHVFFVETGCAVLVSGIAGVLVESQGSASCVARAAMAVGVSALFCIYVVKLSPLRSEQRNGVAQHRFQLLSAIVQLAQSVVMLCVVWAAREGRTDLARTMEGAGDLVALLALAVVFIAATFLAILSSSCCSNEDNSASTPHLAKSSVTAPLLEAPERALPPGLRSGQQPENAGRTAIGVEGSVKEPVRAINAALGRSDAHYGAQQPHGRATNPLNSGQADRR
jgi:hypothetical protein